MGLRKLLRRHTETDAADLSPDIAEWLAYDETLRGGYVFTADPDAAPMTLTAPIVPRSTTFWVSVPSDELPAGQCYLLGGPEEPTCEVVQVASDAPEPDGSRRIRRVLFDTIGGNHPVGTLVTPVSVGRVAGLPPAVP
jgi:hypothetical protein